jgi:ABC-type transport system substrate-binding protein
MTDKEGDMSSETWDGGGAARRALVLRTRSRLLALVGLGAIAAAACGSATSGTATPSGPTNYANVDPANWNESTVSWLKANANSTGTAPSTPTGTLTMAGSNDVSGMLDPQAEYDTVGYRILEALSRPLMFYPPSTSFNKATSLVPDGASSYSVSADGLTYTFTVRSDMRWAITDPSSGQPVAGDGSPVTAADYALGIERNCDPSINGYNNPAYYTATIKGFSSFCSGFQALPTTATPAQRAAYIQANPVSGISVPNSSTLVITLTGPASDFLNLMAMFFTAAAPQQSLNYTPLTAGNPIWSDGSYEVKNYTPGSKIDLVPNPYWGAASGTDTTSTTWSSDPVAARYSAEITVDETLSASAAAAEVQQEIVAGTLDFEWNTVVPPSELPGLANYTNPEFGAFPTPGITNPYLVFNLQASSPLQNVKVRQALEYAVDKVALTKIYGGASFNTVLNQVMGPGAEGYVPGYNPYPTPNNAGDPTKCKSLLKAAGYANGFTITDFYRTDGNHPAIFEEIQKDFGACGVTVTGKGIANGYYTATGILQTSASALASAGWNITEPGWVPDWYGPNNARSILPDLFGSSNFPGTNWGDFSNSTVDGLITQAEAAPTTAAANSLWQQANKAVMAQAPFIPFMGQLTTIMHASSVHNCLFDPFSDQFNITEAWTS